MAATIDHPQSGAQDGQHKDADAVDRSYIDFGEYLVQILAALLAKSLQLPIDFRPKSKLGVLVPQLLIGEFVAVQLRLNLRRKIERTELHVSD